MNQGLAFAVLCLCWGSTFVALKEGLSGLPPLLLMSLRFLLAGGVLWAWLAARGKLGISARDGLELLPPTLLMIPVGYGLLAWGMQFVDSGLSAVVNLASVAISILLFSLLYRQETFVWPKLLGIGLGVAGLVLLWSPSGELEAQGVLAVAGLALGSACYAWGTVLGRPVLGRYSAVEVSSFQMSVGGVILLLLSLFLERPTLSTWARLLEPNLAFSVLYLAGVGSLLGFTLYQGLLKVWPATRVAAYTFVCPVIAVALGALIYAERGTLAEGVASALMLLGAFVAMRARGY